MDITFERSFADPRGGSESLRRLARSSVVAALFGALVVWGTVGTLASADEPGFVSEHVAVTSEAGTMFSMPALAPGETVARYASVASTGSPAALRLYATISGTGLARFLTVTVTRGTGGTDAFVPYGDDRGAGPGVVYHGALSHFPTAWGSGLDVGGTWAPGETHTFRFDIRMSDKAGAQGLTAGADFRWEARES
jgi:hypothetical protein